MNRIREIRTARGMSQASLAERVGTSQPTIDRLEKGERRLTENWMRKIAEALDVTPADLITIPTPREFREEVTAYRPAELEPLLAQLDAANKVFMQIDSDSVENLGIARGDVRLFDMSAAAVAAVKTGDVVIAQLYDTDPKVLKASTVLRQYVAPGLLITNRAAANMAFTMITSTFEAHIKMVMVAGAPPTLPAATVPPSAKNGTQH